jgi:hypothetical protein
MTMTVNSSFTAYCTASQFTSLFDWRPFGQYCVDTDTPPANVAAFQSNPVLLNKLQVASGLIEMAATRGARYDPTDLVALVTPVNAVIANGGWALIQMCAGLAAFEIVGRRMEGLPEYIVDSIERSQAMLVALENGEKIFPFADAQQAGLLHDYLETSVDVQNRNLPAVIASPLFGIRSNQIPYGTGSSSTGG